MHADSKHFRSVGKRGLVPESVTSLDWRGFRVKAQPGAGFSLIELLVVVAVALIVAAFAIPTMTQTLDAYRTRGALNSASVLAQQCRMQAVKSDITERMHFQTISNQVVLWVADTTDANPTPQAGDPQLHGQLWLNKDFSRGLPTVPQLTAQTMWGSNLNNINVNVDAYFNSRGMPCLPVAGATCGLTNGFVYYFRYKDAGTRRWLALSISPAGRIETWFWNGQAWGN